MLTSTMSGVKIESYSPEREEKYTKSRALLSSLLSKTDDSVTEHKQDLEVLSQLLTDFQISNELIPEIKASIKSNNKVGSVGEALFSCVIQQENSENSACTPECLSGLPTEKSECSIQVFLKTPSSLQRINSVDSRDASVYLSGDANSLSESDEEELRQNGVREVSVFRKKEKSNSYVRQASISIPEESGTRSTSFQCRPPPSSSSSSSNSSSTKSTRDTSRTSSEEEVSQDCPRTKKCLPPKKNIEHPKSNASWAWIIAAFIIILIIIGIGLFFWYRGFGSSQNTEAQSCATTTPTTCWK